MKLLAYNFNEALFIHDFVILNGTNEQNQRVKDILLTEDTNVDTLDLNEGEWFKVTFGDEVYLQPSGSPDEVKDKMRHELENQIKGAQDYVSLEEVNDEELANDGSGVEHYKDKFADTDELIEYLYKETYEEQTVDGPTGMEIKILQFNPYEYKSTEEFLKIYDEGKFRRPEASDWE